jgi:hypothetical protein
MLASSTDQSHMCKCACNCVRAFAQVIAVPGASLGPCIRLTIAGVFVLNVGAVCTAGTLSSCLQGLLRGGGGVSLSLEQVRGLGMAWPY